MNQIITISGKQSLSYPLTKDIIVFLRFQCESALICKGIILTVLNDSKHIWCLANRENYKLHWNSKAGQVWAVPGTSESQEVSFIFVSLLDQLGTFEPPVKWLGAVQAGDSEIIFISA